MNAKILLNSAAEYHGVTVEQILGHSRRKQVLRARDMFIWNAHHNDYSLNDIGHAVNRHHSTIIAAERRMGLRRKEVQ